MRILVIGAGATGGYFGARLAQTGRDVTFLVREKRAALLAANGLIVRSPLGDIGIAAPATITADRLTPEFDLIVFSCKAYDLTSALDDISPAVVPGTIILPLLNGMRHIEAIEARFPAARVLGGQCVISTTIDDSGAIIHLNSVHSVTFGARRSTDDAAARQVDAVLQSAGFDAHFSDAILQAMWNKWIVLSSMAGATCAMRGTIGAINRAPGGTAFIHALVAEVADVAAKSGFPPSAAYLDEIRGFLANAETDQTSSMYRDIGNGQRIEADHIIGDLLVRASALGLSCPAFSMVYTHLKTYEQQRA